MPLPNLVMVSNANDIYSCLSFRYGRYPVMVFGIVVHIATRIGLAFSPNFTVFALFKFLTAAFAIGWYTTTYIYGKGTCMLKHKIIYD